MTKKKRYYCAWKAIVSCSKIWIGHRKEEDIYLFPLHIASLGQWWYTDKLSVTIVILLTVVSKKVNVRCFRNRMLTLITGFKAFSALALISESATGHCCNPIWILSCMQTQDHGFRRSFIISVSYFCISVSYFFYIVYVSKFFTAYCTVLRGIIIRIFVFPKKRLAI